MQGQANHFYRLAKERIPYPTQRYVGEAERLYGILDKQLESREYLVGPGKGKYSIADIANFSVRYLLRPIGNTRSNKNSVGQCCVLRWSRPC
jgi:glutathione S-transferase